jgi:hypothetical protein
MARNRHMVESRIFPSVHLSNLLTSEYVPIDHIHFSLPWYKLASDALINALI